MSDYTPLLANLKDAYVYVNEGMDGSLRAPKQQLRAEFDRAIAAHDAEVHRLGYQTALDDVRSGAFISGSSYEAVRDSQTGQRIRAELRKSIADGIGALFVSTETRHGLWDAYFEGYLDALDAAEQIAEGEA